MGRRKEWAFAFFNFGGEKAFVSPNVASKFNVTDGEEHSVSGYDVTYGNALYTSADFTFKSGACRYRLFYDHLRDDSCF